MNAGMVAEWLASGELDLPLPGRGSTAARWRRLAALTETDIVAGRLAEAHADAVAILADLEGPDVQPDELWGVWAAESAISWRLVSFPKLTFAISSRCTCRAA